MKIIWVIFPENATRIFHPYDIVLFKTFKLSLKKEIDKHFIKTISTYLTKKEAIYLPSKSQEEGLTRILENIVSGLINSGIWPTYFTLIIDRLNSY